MKTGSAKIEKTWILRGKNYAGESRVLEVTEQPNRQTFSLRVGDQSSGSQKSKRGCTIVLNEDDAKIVLRILRTAIKRMALGTYEALG